MIANIVNLLSRAMTAGNVQKSTSVTTVSKNQSTNPFGNPFVSSEGRGNYASYAKNKPVSGGYFAGYYNGRANIVGQRLFVEV